MFFTNRKLKPLTDVALAKKEKALGMERCEAVLYPGGLEPNAVGQEVHTKALWAGLKPIDNKFYTVNHCQPLGQKANTLVRREVIQSFEDKYDTKNYTPINYQTLTNGGNRDLTDFIFANGKRDSQSYMKHNGVSGTFENVGYDTGNENNFNHSSQQFYNYGTYAGGGGGGYTRAAYVLGGNNNETLGGRLPITDHHYEMIQPRHSPSKRNMTLGRNVTISGPTSLPAGIRLPPLNGRNERYALTALANGKHTLTRRPSDDPRRSQVQYNYLPQNNIMI